MLTLFFYLKKICFKPGVSKLQPPGDSRFFAGQYQTGQFSLTLFSDYSLTKEKKHSNFKQIEQDKLKKDKKTHRTVLK